MFRLLAGAAAAFRTSDLAGPSMLSGPDLKNAEFCGAVSIDYDTGSANNWTLPRVGGYYQMQNLFLPQIQKFSSSGQPAFARLLSGQALADLVLYVRYAMGAANGRDQWCVGDARSLTASSVSHWQAQADCYVAFDGSRSFVKARWEGPGTKEDMFVAWDVKVGGWMHVIMSAQRCCAPCLSVARAPAEHRM